MPPRLNHKKSRNGCNRCKARRVKCDEGHPICNNCKRHGVVCEFPSAGRRIEKRRPRTVPEISQSIAASESFQSNVASERFQSSDSIGGIGVAPPTPQSNDKESTGSPSQASPPHVEFNSPYESGDDEEGSLNPDERRMLEVRLLHHFTTVVSYSFPSSTTSSIRDMWNIEAVRYGFTYEFLLNAIFAISALHIVRDISESPRFFPDFYADSFRVRNHVLSTAKPTLGNVSPAKVHRFYLNLAVRQQRQAVMCLSAENTNAIILSSVLISYQGMKLHPEEDELQDYIPPVQWLYMTNAITHISCMAVSLLKEKSVAQFLASTSGAPDFRDKAAIFNPKNRKPFEALLRWSEYPEPGGADSNTQAVYEKTVEYVGGVYQALKANESPRVIFRRILCLGPLIPAQFIHFIEERRPRALAILAHHCAMARSIDDHWVFHGLAEREVRGIQSILPLEWQWAMEWPLAMLNQEIGNVP